MTIVAVATGSVLAQGPVTTAPYYNGGEFAQTGYASQPTPQPGTSNYWAGGCDSCDQGSNVYANGAGYACDSNCGASNRPGWLFGNLLGSRLLPSESCFDCFISPVTNPFYFEDPRALTEIRPVFINHTMPAALGGGTVNVYAIQLRARLSENVSFIAVKNGYYTSSSPVFDEGWADLGMGLKFNLWRDPVNQQLLSAGATFEAPSGSDQAQQGLGSGNLNLFFSLAHRLGQNWNHMSSGGLRVPMDGDTGSTSTYMSQHLSRPITERFYILTEANWFRYISSGTGGIAGVEGLDLANFGSTDVTGNNIVTWAAGGKFKTARNSELGAAYEIPISGRRDIMGNRVTAHWAIRF